MKQQYIRQVKKALNLPREQKAEVLRDLDEAFASALEHGETERQVIERLGTPEDIARAMVYLADAAFITGQVLPVNGGFVIT